MQQMNMSVLSGDTFIFINKKRNQVKLLLWEGDGLALYYKRLEEGTYELPVCNNEHSCMHISYQQLSLILEGISLKSVRRRKRYQQVA
jgi:transposase